VDSPSQSENSPIFPLAVNRHYASPDLLLETARQFAKSCGFTIACNSHPFSKLKPHPIHGADSKIWQRAKAYCNHKDPIIKVKNKGLKSTCTWFVTFTFDRSVMDYVITRNCIEHNHDLKSGDITLTGGLVEVTLAAHLEVQEVDMVHQLARYNLQLFKVFD
jgi:hypothetical protein